MKIPFYIIKNFYYFYSSGRGREAHAIICVEVRGQLVEIRSLLYHVGARDGTPVGRLNIDF